MSLNDLPWDNPAAYIETHEVLAKEIDDFNHVNNLIYLKWCNEIAWHHSQRLGLNFQDYERIGVGLVVREHKLTYLAAAKLGDTVAIGTWISSNDNKLRMTRNYQIFNVASQTLCLTGSTVFVPIDMVSQRPRRMPQEFKDTYLPTV